jgi:hypothetical protein
MSGINIQLDNTTLRYLSALPGIAGSLAAIEKTLLSESIPLPVAVSISLSLPTLTKNGVIMANFELANDEVATIPILVDDAAGQPVPPPAGDTFTAVSSSPSLGVAVVTTPKAAVVLTPMVQASPGISVTVSDSAGLTSFILVVDIVEDTTAKAITLDVADATEVSQPTPTAPGP